MSFGLIRKSWVGWLLRTLLMQAEWLLDINNNRNSRSALIGLSFTFFDSISKH